MSGKESGLFSYVRVGSPPASTVEPEAIKEAETPIQEGSGEDGFVEAAGSTLRSLGEYQFSRRSMSFD